MLSFSKLLVIALVLSVAFAVVDAKVCNTVLLDEW
jgi:hypothetical protein